MMKNAFYFILKVFFVLKIFKFLSERFGHVIQLINQLVLLHLQVLIGQHIFPS